MGDFVVKRRTDWLRLTRKLKRTGYPGAAADAYAGVLPYQWLCSVLRGHYAYFGLRAIGTGLALSIKRHGASGIGRSIAAASVGSRGSAMSVCSNVSQPVARNHPSSTGGRLLTRPTSGGAELRKPHARICEGKWLSYSTLLPRFSQLAISIIDVEWPATRSENQQCPARNSQTSGA